tara:strand:- start:7211 stop:7627 length:417 start_codon:yes stop_codon:yes gene_type:complete
MAYTNAKYTKDGVIQTDDMSIPADVSNRHYAEMMKLVESGELTITAYAPPTPAELMVEKRKTMVCSPLQGRLALGEATCNAIDSMSSDPTTPWAMKQTINSAIQWSRTSQSIDELGYLLGYTPAQMDDLFTLAMTIEV